jgi:superfamily II DNA/RNA helicase
LEDVEVLVLDEADRLIEMGFKDDVMRIVKQCTYSKRQTIMVSATLNQDLKELSSYALKQPLTFSVQ